MSALENEPDCEPGCAHPRDCEELLGLEIARREFADALNNQRMHHAWMITGAKGVGKASFAYWAARQLLAGNNPAITAQRISAQSHPNLLVVRRPWDEKTKKWKTVVTINETRRIPHFFAQSAAEPGWRVAIIDSMDEANTNACNGLLKSLEEPPEMGVLFLVCQTPGRLPPTIRSRCRVLNLRPPEPAETAAWMTSEHHLDEDDAMEATLMAQGAPGRALALHHSGAVKLEREIEAWLNSAAAQRGKAGRKLAARVAARGADTERRIFFDQLKRALANRAKTTARERQDGTDWVSAWQSVGQIGMDVDRVHLDPKQATLAALNVVEQAISRQAS